ncbi:hypothetical protein LTS07_009183 [Exophiala sideris]|nr:hypothetical protein LTS07_009183 [Exophiala sideris]KAK5029675.1 hypothetical protein LTR13_008595 [Exophiala sideris]
MEDVRKLGPFSLILFFFHQLTPLIHRFLSPVIPGPCRRQQDYMRDVKRYINSWESFRDRFHDQDEIFAESQFGEAMNQATKRRHMLYTAILRTSIFSGLAIYIPPSFTDLALRLYGKGLMIRNLEILADTALIMREGGFSKLRTEDIVDYCIRSGSVTFYKWAREAVENGVSPANAVTRKGMVDILEQHAKKMLDCDWPRLPPHSLWKQELFVRFYDRTAPDSWLADKRTARR